MLKQLLIAFVFIFLGFIIGRIGHVFGGSLNAPHHWIYGVIFVIIGIIFRKKSWGIIVLVFGAGLFVSDLRDFLMLKFYGPDVPGPKSFWHID